jgi:hypothetical protein
VNNTKREGSCTPGRTSASCRPLIRIWTRPKCIYATPYVYTAGHELSPPCNFHCASVMKDSCHADILNKATADHKRLTRPDQPH